MVNASRDWLEYNNGISGAIVNTLTGSVTVPQETIESAQTWAQSYTQSQTHNTSYTGSYYSGYYSTNELRNAFYGEYIPANTTTIYQCDVMQFQYIRMYLDIDSQNYASYYFTSPEWDDNLEVRFYKNEAQLRINGQVALNMYTTDMCAVRFICNGCEVMPQWKESSVGSWNSDLGSYTGGVPNANTVPNCLSLDVSYCQYGDVVIGREYTDTYTHDLTYTPSEAMDYSVSLDMSMPLDNLIGKSASDLLNIGNPPIDLSGILDFLQSILQKLIDIWNAVTSIPATISQSITDALDEFWNDGQLNLEPLRISVSSLTTKFPFSLPWDIRRSLTVLNTSGEFKPFEVAFPNPITQEMIEFEIDASMFANYLAPITRAGFMLMYTLGLVFLTNKLIGGAK